MSDALFCKDCEYHGIGRRCYRPTNELDVFNGRMIKLDRPVEKERDVQMYDTCGPCAKYFKAKGPSLLRRLWKLCVWLCGWPLRKRYENPLP